MRSHNPTDEKAARWSGIASRLFRTLTRASPAHRHNWAVGSSQQLVKPVPVADYQEIVVSRYKSLLIRFGCCYRFFSFLPAPHP
jgi:hypothetical protein